MRGNYRHPPGDPGAQAPGAQTLGAQTLGAQTLGAQTLGAQAHGSDWPGVEVKGRSFHQRMQHQPVTRELIPPIVTNASPHRGAERVIVAHRSICVGTGPRYGRCGARVSPPVTPGPGPGSAVAASATPGGTR